VEAYGLTDPGLVRPNNQDSFALVPELGLFMAADGMGGAAAGDFASRMAIESVQAIFTYPAATWPQGLGPRSVRPGLEFLVDGVRYANARVHAAACADRAKKGMGTTLTGLLVLEDQIAIAHVGDSRCYRLHGQHIEQLTVDHTLVGGCVDTGAMTLEEAASSPFAHILTRAVGTHENVTVDARLVTPEHADTFVLTSDGLHGQIRDEEIAKTLLDEPDLMRAANRLIEQANEAGGPDNITVVLLRIA
jgi:protein phosphatase